MSRSPVRIRSVAPSKNPGKAALRLAFPGFLLAVWRGILREKAPCLTLFPDKKQVRCMSKINSCEVRLRYMAGRYPRANRTFAIGGRGAVRFFALKPGCSAGFCVKRRKTCVNDALRVLNPSFWNGIILTRGEEADDKTCRRQDREESL